MKWYKRIVGTINWIVIVAAAVFVMLWYGRPEWLDPIPQWLASEPARPIMTVSAIALLLLNLVCVAGWIAELEGGSEIRIRKEDGVIRIKSVAVEELLQRVCLSFPTVVHARVRVHAASGGWGPVRVSCTLTMEDQANLPAMMEKVRNKIRQRFEEALPFGRKVEINLGLNDIVKGELEGGAEEGRLGTSAFLGPEYYREEASSTKSEEKS